MATQLTEHVWQVELTGVNAYLVEDGDDLTLVDTGSPIDVGRLRRSVAKTEHSLSRVDRVLVTHYDLDHVGALARTYFDADVHMGQPDADYFTGRADPPLSELKGVFHRALRSFARPGDDLEIQPLTDGEQVGSFTAYHTPGHTPGHFAFVSEELSVAFVGDMVMERDGRFEPSPWFLSYDTEEVRDSIHEFADREPAVECVCPGHGVPFIRNGAVRMAECGQRID